MWKEQAREEVLEMAFSHANEKCRAAILTLPMNPMPTLQAMLEVCEQKVPWMSQPVGHQGKQTAVKTAAAVVAEASNTLPAPHSSVQKKCPPRGSAERPCLLCGKTGHWCLQCPVKKDFDKFRERGGGEGGKGGKPLKAPRKN